ncbi:MULTISPECIES: hypothetical protein [Cryobacterium]|uniref:hypothetical protein n=1 Tax=Cryobacterium TaxID=69578 RepID=UPI000CD40BA3|nr:MULTISPECIES: hypothetical protein [Cryobacterium]POH63638.1 hypothetical protein C3B60_16115 [Cryobacterium zongtaii]TFC45573.1 hypothetical protein E3O57_07970 [Cryobacterium sp. TMN-39-2]
MIDFTYTITDTMSGVPQAKIFPVPAPFSKAVNETAGNQTTIPVDASPFTAAELEQLTEDWSRSIVIALNGVDIYSGVIQDYDWDDESGMLVLGHQDSRAIYGSRTTLGSNGYSGDQPSANSLILNGYSLASIPPWLSWAATEGPTANYDFPVFIEEGKITIDLLSSLNTPGPWNFEFWDHDFPFVNEQFRRLQALGLEIDLEPRVNSVGDHELLLRSGKLAGGTFDFNLTQPKCPIGKLRVRRNSQRRANVIYSVGKGAGQTMMVTTSRAEPTGVALELAEAFKEIDDPVNLQALSDENLATLRKPIRQWEFDLPLDYGPGIEKIRFGSLFRIYSRDHKVIQNGWNEMRYLGYEIDPTKARARMTVQDA